MENDTEPEKSNASISNISFKGKVNIFKWLLPKYNRFWFTEHHLFIYFSYLHTFLKNKNTKSMSINFIQLFLNQPLHISKLGKES